MKKLNRKGFSLVELIVVIAIMAVLVGVLAPSLLRNVEKSRLQKDNSAISEVVEAAKIACADEAINKEVAKGTVTIVLGGDLDNTTITSSASGADLDAFIDELTATVGDELEMTSNTYTDSGATMPTIEISVSGTTVEITVTDYMASVNSAAEDTVM